MAHIDTMFKDLSPFLFPVFVFKEFITSEVSYYTSLKFTIVINYGVTKGMYSYLLSRRNSSGNDITLVIPRLFFLVVAIFSLGEKTGTSVKLWFLLAEQKLFQGKLNVCMRSKIHIIKENQEN